jgi:hypothetical protein
VRTWVRRRLRRRRDGWKAQAAKIKPDRRTNPEVLSWAVAAIFAITNDEDALRILRSHGIALNGALLLASAQHAAKLREMLSSHRVDIDNDSALELRLASLLLGFDIAPEHMFSDHHENRSVVGELNRHPDNLVAQYSVWAIRENPALGLSDLGFPLKDIESRPANVRSWTYQLVSRDTDSFDDNLDLLECAAFDDESKAREGMAIGIRERWVDGMDYIIIDWTARENDVATMSYLYEHMAAQSDQSPAYSELIRRIYADAKYNALQRAQLEVAASGTSLYSEMQRIQIEERRQQDMFVLNRTDGSSIVQQIFNSGGGAINVGANAPTGNIAIKNQKTLLDSSEALSDKLNEALDFVRALEVTPEIRQDAEKALEEASQTSTPGKVQKVIEALKNIKDAAVYSEQTVSAVTHLIEFFNKWCN